MFTQLTWWRAWGLSLAGVATLLPMAGALTLTTMVMVLSITPAGLALIPTAARCNQWTADLRRQLAASGLGRVVEAGYRPLPRTGVASAVVKDQRRWADVGWLIVGLAPLCVLPTLAAFGFVVGIVAWPVWATDHSGLTGLALMLLCWGIWAALLIPLTQLWMRLDAALLGDDQAELRRRLASERARRVEQLDHSAAEMKRIERDLHDGAQARLASVGMTLGLAAELTDRDPAATRSLIEEAAATSNGALADIRAVVRGMRPPVLADRGLGGAIAALVVDLPIPVETELDLPGPLPDPMESTLYFAVCELLANAVKHSGCSRAWVLIRLRDNLLTTVVGDDGAGGATLTTAGGLMGVSRRIAAFDGTMTVDSPAGGPTRLLMEVPCA